MTFGTTTTEMAVTKTIRRLLPDLPMDPAVLASEIVKNCELAATEVIDNRERAFQAAMKATLDYTGQVIESLRSRVSDLEAERTDLHLKVARLTQATTDD